MAAWMYKTYHPEIFQGHTSKQKYFEGYYYKLVSADEQHAIAVIPGIAIYDKADRHAFIQLIDGVGQVTSYHRFPLDQFSEMCIRDRDCTMNPFHPLIRLPMKFQKKHSNISSFILFPT